MADAASLATAPSYPAPAAATTPAALTAGGTIVATALAPGSGAGAPAAGTSFSVRVLAAAAPSAMNAILLQSSGGTTVVETPMGRLARGAQIEAAPLEALRPHVGVEA